MRLILSHVSNVAVGIAMIVGLLHTLLRTEISQQLFDFTDCNAVTFWTGIHCPYRRNSSNLTPVRP